MPEQLAKDNKKPTQELTQRIAGEVVLSDDAGATLRKWREDFNVSQSELSDALGVSNSVVSDYESGRRASPGIGVVRRIVEALVEIDMQRGGDVLRRYRRILGAGFEGSAVKDLRDYETPVPLGEFHDAIDAREIVGDKTEIKGHTVVDSLEAIRSLSGEEFAQLYGWSTERALVFTNITRGESPLVAVRVTSLKPSAVVLHGISRGEISRISEEIARLEGVALSYTTMDMDEMLENLGDI
ncbi:MAG: helix-turn-helix domain-containing protein [Halobacteriales archaeon]|nr:helix-turn-helix domain-containing protein [Halobacteriales archaeon]